MRKKQGASKVAIQFGKMTVASDQTSTLVTDPVIDLAKNVCIAMTAHENVSFSVLEQNSNEFLIITSDTANATAEYIIASTI